MTGRCTDRPLPSASQLVRAHGRRARRSLGQHFLTDPVILERLVSLSGVQAGERILEVGTGPGTLTRTLLAHGCSVVAVEIDEVAVQLVHEHLGRESLQLIQGDVLKLDLRPLLTDDMKVVANLPYNVATEIFFKLEIHCQIKEMLLMFQREVARRFVGAPGSKDFGPLALLSQIRWDAEIVLQLPPGAFTPRPKVFSSAVRFQHRALPRVPEQDEPLYRILVRTAFQQRRKQIKNALSSMVGLDHLSAAAIDPTARPEDVPLEGFALLAGMLREERTGPREEG